MIINTHYKEEVLSIYLFKFVMSSSFLGAVHLAATVCALAVGALAVRAGALVPRVGAFAGALTLATSTV